MVLEVDKMTKEEQRKILGNNLVALLELKEKSRKDVSDALNTSYTKVCDWTKARTYPNQHDLGRLAFYFDTTIEQLTSANAVIKENGFDPEKSTSKKKVSVIDIGTDEWVISPVDYEWVSIKHLKPNTGYLMFDVVDDMLSPIYNSCMMNQDLGLCYRAFSLLSHHFLFQKYLLQSPISSPALRYIHCSGCCLGPYSLYC